jgi:hypothetical protein
VVGEKGGEAMTKMLAKAFEKAARLPASVQNDLAREILARIEHSQREEDALFAQAHEVLEKLAEQSLVKS